MHEQREFPERSKSDRSAYRQEPIERQPLSKNPPNATEVLRRPQLGEQGILTIKGIEEIWVMAVTRAADSNHNWQSFPSRQPSS